jgi:glycosyltransferase involved in cell wall biosynthesis
MQPALTAIRRKLRVLHLSPGKRFGGVETALVTLARCRDLCPDMEPLFGVCFEGRLRDELLGWGVPVYDIEPVRVSRPWTVPRARRQASRLIETTGADVVVCHMPWTAGVFAPAVRDAGAPLVFWAHSPPDGRHWIERWARLTPPDLAICNSGFTAASIPRLFPEAPVEVVYCPVVRPDYSSTLTRGEVRASLDLSNDAIVLIQVCRMEGWKGHAIHLRALAQLQDLPYWVSLIVGGPQTIEEREYQRSLESLAASLGIANRVRFLGERRDVGALLRAADIHCQPNIAPDPFGIAFVEALQAGLPVVTSGIGGAVELLGDDYGVLVPPNDAGMLASRLRELIASHEFRSRFASRGPERATEVCDPARQIDRLRSVLAPFARSSMVN